MLLDFEKPIVELDEKIADMKSLAQQNDVDVSDAIKSLEEKLQKLKKETYNNLTRWQRVQLSRHQNRPYTLDYIYEITDDFIRKLSGGTKVEIKYSAGVGFVVSSTILKKIAKSQKLHSNLKRKFDLLLIPK